MKKYCKNCRWFSVLRSCRHPDYRGPKTSDSVRDKGRSKASGLLIKRKITYFPILGDYDKYNKNNNCRYYRRKWWKFWLKKKAVKKRKISREIKNKIANIIYVLTFQYSQKTESQKTKAFNETVEILYELFSNLINNRK